MDIVENKYKNFQNFVSSTVSDPANESIQRLFKTPLNFFLAAVKEKSNSGVSKEQCLDEIFETTNLDKSKFKDEDISKLCRYMEYFLEVSKCI